MSTSNDVNPSRKKRPGGRSERVRRSVLEAALTQLLDHGYDAFSIGDVAKAAGVAETTVYRRWPTKADLAAAALGEMAAAANPAPDTGTLEGDLQKLLQQIVNLLRRPEIERLVRAAAAIDTARHTRQARTAYWHTRFAGSGEVVTRAIARGELPPDTSPEALIEMLVAPAYFRVLVTGEPLDKRLLEECVRRTVLAYGDSRGSSGVAQRTKNGAASGRDVAATPTRRTGARSLDTHSNGGKKGARS